MSFEDKRHTEFLFWTAGRIRRKPPDLNGLREWDESMSYLCVLSCAENQNTSAGCFRLMNINEEL